MTTENILCVPTAILWPDASQTQRPCTPQELEAIIAEHGVFVPRDKCETDESLQQIIPYIVVTSGDHVLAYTRIKGGEKRLDGVISVGFGGHINDGDQGEGGVLLNGTLREYEEEVGWPSPCGFEEFNPPRMIFRYLSDAVGRVHTGFLLVDDWQDATGVNPRAENSVQPVYGWIDHRMIADHPRLEPWGKIALGLIYGEGK